MLHLISWQAKRYLQQKSKKMKVSEDKISKPLSFGHARIYNEHFRTVKYGLRVTGPDNIQLSPRFAAARFVFG